MSCRLSRRKGLTRLGQLRLAQRPIGELWKWVYPRVAAWMAVPSSSQVRGSGADPAGVSLPISRIGQEIVDAAVRSARLKRTVTLKP